MDERRRTTTAGSRCSCRRGLWEMTKFDPVFILLLEIVHRSNNEYNGIYIYIYIYIYSS